MSKIALFHPISPRQRHSIRPVSILVPSPSCFQPRLHPRPVSIPVLYVELLTQLLPHLPLYSIILFFAEKTDIRPKSESHSIDHLRQPQKRGCPCLSGVGRKRSFHLHHKALRCHRCPHTSSPSFCCHRQRIGCPRACPIHSRHLTTKRCWLLSIGAFHQHNSRSTSP